MKKNQTITSLPPSPEQEHRSRVIKYSVTMAIRMVCVILIFVLDGWWRIGAAIGAIVLPYIAVVLANVSKSVVGATVERPGAIVPLEAPPVRPSAQSTDTDPQ
jgi:predicted tellurium resistance membrane protein TerC